MDDRSIENLVWASRSGDGEAYAQLMHKYYKRIYLLCLGIVSDVHDAEDIAQEVFLNGYVKIGQLKKPLRFESWISRIARNLCMDHLRGRKLIVSLSENLPVLSKDAEGYEELERTIQKLPEELRLPLVLYYFDGRDVNTVAKTMNISVSGAYSRIRTATQQLHRMLTEE